MSAKAQFAGRVAYPLFLSRSVACLLLCDVNCQTFEARAGIVTGFMRGGYNGRMLIDRLTIVGMGLMGGSLGLALRPSVRHLTVVEKGREALAAIEAWGQANVVTDSLADGAAQAEAIIFATPVQTIINQIERLPALSGGCFVLDSGSVKQEICHKMETLPPSFAAIGGHPMCGKESGGFKHADPALFQGQTFVLCPTARTTPTVRALAQQLVKAVGAIPLEMGSDLHDQIVAVTSHLPYLLSATLMQQGADFARKEGDVVWQTSASGFRDSSRLAGSDPKMMLDILLSNRQPILERINDYASSLERVRQALSDHDADWLLQWLTASQSEQNAYVAAKYDDSLNKEK